MARNERKTQKVEIISEVELVEVRALRTQLAEMRQAERQAAARLAAYEQGIIQALARGAVVQGRFTALIEQQAGRCSPKWRDEYLNHMEGSHGLAREAAEAAVREEYPPEPKEILVIEIAPGQIK